MISSLVRTYQRHDAELQNHVVPEMHRGFSLRFSDYAAHDEAYGVALLALENFWGSLLRKFSGTSPQRTGRGSRRGTHKAGFLTSRQGLTAAAVKHR